MDVTFDVHFGAVILGRLVGSRINVKFGEHVPSARVDSLVSQLAAYGIVEGNPSDGAISVEVSRTSKMAGLRGQLVAWDREGYLRWSEIPISN